MTRKIAVFTGTRAEYGLLHWLMHDIQADPDVELQVIAAAMHLSPEFGETHKEITSDGFQIDARVEMLLSSNTGVGVAKSMGVGVLGFADALDRLQPDMLVILGDRFEALAIAQTALVLGIPIAHLHGGEVTEGAFDDAMRHAITKMASLHFVSTEPYAARVVQMGTPPERVFNVGAFGLDHLKRSSIMGLPDLAESIGFPLQNPFVLATYHPVTAGEEDPVATTRAMLDAFDSFPDHQVLITFPNADTGGRDIIPVLKDYASAQPDRVCAVPSLGFRRYQSALSYASAMVGNSSSGLIEAPAFKKPIVNIGVRQKGRMASDAVIHCAAQADGIREALRLALSPEGQARAAAAQNPYGQGNASQATLAAIKANPGPFPNVFHDLEGVQ
ncbi:MAG: UDP-N-acetylglucosamine 2-epimerase [Paracoccaceae bacterium]